MIRLVLLGLVAVSMCQGKPMSQQKIRKFCAEEKQKYDARGEETPVYNADPDDCQSYYVCTYYQGSRIGTAAHQSCAEGTVWQQDITSCTFSKSHCPVKEPEVPENSKSEGKSEEKSEEPDEKYPVYECTAGDFTFTMKNDKEYTISDSTGKVLENLSCPEHTPYFDIVKCECAGREKPDEPEKPNEKLETCTSGEYTFTKRSEKEYTKTDSTGKVLASRFCPQHSPYFNIEKCRCGTESPFDKPVEPETPVEPNDKLPDLECKRGFYQYSMKNEKTYTRTGLFNKETEDLSCPEDAPYFNIILCSCYAKEVARDPIKDIPCGVSLSSKECYHDTLIFRKPTFNLFRKMYYVMDVQRKTVTPKSCPKDAPEFSVEECKCIPEV